jgi:RES domain-containing protein
MQSEHVDENLLSTRSWRDEMEAKGEAQTQTLARTLIGKGYRGLLVRSFANGATENDLNLVLWRWGDAPPARLSLVDDEGRLSR